MPQHPFPPVGNQNPLQPRHTPLQLPQLDLPIPQGHPQLAHLDPQIHTIILLPHSPVSLRDNPNLIQHMHPHQQPPNLVPDQAHMALQLNLCENPIQQKGVGKSILGIVEARRDFLGQLRRAAEDEGAGEAGCGVKDGGDGEGEGEAGGGAGVVDFFDTLLVLFGVPEVRYLGGDGVGWSGLTDCGGGLGMFVVGEGYVVEIGRVGAVDETGRVAVQGEDAGDFFKLVAGEGEVFEDGGVGWSFELGAVC